MKFIFLIILILLCVIFGYYLGKNYSEYYKKLLQQERIKRTKINMIIRSTRNKLMAEETKMKMIPKDEQKNNCKNYIDIKAKLQIIREIEEEIANEMQEI